MSTTKKKDEEGGLVTGLFQGATKWAKNKLKINNKEDKKPEETKPKPKKKKRGLMTKFEKKQAERQRKSERAKAWRENRAKNKNK